MQGQALLDLMLRLFRSALENRLRMSRLQLLREVYAIAATCGSPNTTKEITIGTVDAQRF